jgi:hypothetical protein
LHLLTGATIVVCKASKGLRTSRRNYGYWFGFYEFQIEMIANASNGFAAFQCGTPENLLLIPLLVECVRGALDEMAHVIFHKPRCPPHRQFAVCRGTYLEKNFRLLLRNACFRQSGQPRRFAKHQGLQQAHCHPICSSSFSQHSSDIFSVQRSNQNDVVRLPC